MHLGIRGAGHSAFIGTLAGPGIDVSNDTGIWAADPQGELRLVARAGDSVPDSGEDIVFPTLTVEHLGSGQFLYSQSENGHVAFGARTTGAGAPRNDYGIWAETDDFELRTVARAGDPAPGVGPETYFLNFFEGSRRAPAINSLGQAAFFARLQGPGVTGSRSRGIWAERSTEELTLVARVGDPAPGVDQDAWFRTMSNPSFNDAGDVLFYATLGGVELDKRMDGGLWRADASNNLELVVREGDTAPGVDGDVIITGIFDASWAAPVMNGHGEFAFFSSLAGPTVDESNDSALWAYDAGGALRIVAREGDPTPGEGHFSELFQFQPYESGHGGGIYPDSRFSINGRGQVALLGDRSGLWAEDRAGKLREIAVTGQEVTVNEFGKSVDRTLKRIYFGGYSGGQDGRPIFFNDEGQLVFTAGISNFSSGIFVSELAMIPEPNCGVLACFALLSVITL